MTCDSAFDRVRPTVAILVQVLRVTGGQMGCSSRDVVARRLRAKAARVGYARRLRASATRSAKRVVTVLRDCRFACVGLYLALALRIPRCSSPSNQQTIQGLAFPRILPPRCPYRMPKRPLLGGSRFRVAGMAFRQAAANWRSCSAGLRRRCSTTSQKMATFERLRLFGCVSGGFPSGIARR